MDVALSRNGARAMRVFFALVVAFLYAPIVILLIFSFNKSAVPSFPLSGFTFHWYREFAANSELRGALVTSAIIATLSSLGAVAARRAGLDRPRTASVPGQARRLCALAEPARDPVRRLRDLAAAALSPARDPSVDPDGRDRPHRHLHPVHDPRGDAAAPTDRRFARGGCLRSRRQPNENVSLDHASADPARRRLGIPDRVHDLVR